MFEVAEGGFLDIDVRIVGPDGKTIYQGERESNGEYTFASTLILLLKPDVYHDPQDCHVQHGHRRGPQ